MKELLAPMALVIFVVAFIRGLIYVQKRLETRRKNKRWAAYDAQAALYVLTDYAVDDTLYSMELFTAAEEARNDFQQPNRQDKQNPVG